MKFRYTFEDETVPRSIRAVSDTLPRRGDVVTFPENIVTIYALPHDVFVVMCITYHMSGTSHAGDPLNPVMFTSDDFGSVDVLLKAFTQRG